MVYESRGRAEVRVGRLLVAGESFGVVVVPAMRAIRHSSLEKLRDFVRDGGMVINIGPLPEASEKEGRGGRALTELVADLFGGGRDRDYEGVAVVCQGYPDAVNRPEFPSPLLAPDGFYCQKTVYRFGTFR